jgi:hypothetical protein
VLAALAAIFSGFCAYLSFKLSCKLRDEMKSDERLIVSKIIHPGLAVQTMTNASSNAIFSTNPRGRPM